MAAAVRGRRIAAILIFPLLIAGCGAAQGTPAGTTTVAEIKAGGEHNDTDVMFLQMLVFHQRQGLDMAGTAAERATGPELKNLIKAVRATEQNELTIMLSWLADWGEPTDVDAAPSAHTGHGGLHGTNPADITRLQTVDAAQFDATFLNMFLAHQHNAIELAQMEIESGANPRAKEFAERVRQTRHGEIRQMLRLTTGDHQ
ncbi:DUF305 domain-containing protein [Actinoplanes sp. NPDC048796]|uniref:DUF305 domain-containing protein n=1 Tax=Actinoplanes sp. NPDC048796 TaxID=3155640 RepID=UPI0033C72E65